MFIPPHISCQKLETFKDAKKTLNEKGVDIGGYIRISTNKDSQKSSIENQKKLLKQWAVVNGYNLVRTYIDVKTGAYTYLRNELQQMFSDAEIGIIHGVVSKEVARTSRDVMDILSIKRTLSDYGAFFISIKENYDSRSDDDEFLLILHGALAQKERKTTSSRVKITQLIKAKEGKTNVPIPAFGYMLSEDRQHIVKNPDTASIFREIVEKFLAGWGQLKIAKWLNQQEIRTRRGGLWTTNAVRTVISNPVYLGVTIYNATTILRDRNGRQKRVVRPQDEWVVRENTHEPLLTEQEFNRIQMIMKQRSEKYRHEWSCDKKYLGSSILRCVTCEGKIYGFRVKRKVKSSKSGTEASYYYRYRCIGTNGKCKGKQKYWNMEIVDRTILSFIASIFSNKNKLLSFIKRNMDLFTNDLNDLIVKREKLKVRLGRISEAMNKQQLAFEQDIITMEEYKERMEEIRNDKRTIQQQIGNLNFNLEKIDIIDEKINKVFKEVNRKIENIYDLPMEEKFQLINHFSEIYIDETGSIVEVKFEV